MSEMVLLIGIQGSGKSTFYRERFIDTHLRINLDMLRTRFREAILVGACFQAKQSFVVDNTNPTKADRQRYIPDAREAKFRVVGYYLSSRIDDAIIRNATRERVVPERAIRGTHGKLEIPSPAEGFDELYYVRIDPAGRFVVAEWTDEV